MAFTDAEVAQFFEIFGIPQGGATVNVTALAHYPYSNVDIWHPTYNVGDLSALVTAVLAKINSSLSTPQATAARETRARALLVEWDNIGTASPMKVTQTANGGAGTIVDHEAERCNIRIRLSNLFGIAVPERGYLFEIQCVLGKSLNSIVNGGLGDR